MFTAAKSPAAPGTRPLPGCSGKPPPGPGAAAGEPGPGPPAPCRIQPGDSGNGEEEGAGAEPEPVRKGPRWRTGPGPGPGLGLSQGLAQAPSKREGGSHRAAEGRRGGGGQPPVLTLAGVRGGGRAGVTAPGPVGPRPLPSASPQAGGRGGARAQRAPALARAPRRSHGTGASAASGHVRSASRLARPRAVGLRGWGGPGRGDDSPGGPLVPRRVRRARQHRRETTGALPAAAPRGGAGRGGAGPELACGAAAAALRGLTSAE